MGSVSVGILIYGTPAHTAVPRRGDGDFLVAAGGVGGGVEEEKYLEVQRRWEVGGV